ncbi:hypothetical protein C1T31_13675 [Hanstruepera neustonica]|uniref:Fungal lipase-type domain-containing protein n=1 Tax=Hanstruepera neustonica TaxID=1445657 RepID=A0A2K1DVF4_9FLAO|nr:Mbeg1-like protein [Hanstruepera neustonica]PNQ72012.1 hypothetical protein C1T31_13675 [Hanstruepera neustonica]
MRILLTALALMIINFHFAQLKPGFNTDEVTTTIALCNSYNFTEQYGSAEAIVPDNYQRSYTSDIIGMDNKFEVYNNGTTGVISFRGSTDKLISWVENFYSAMIPAKGSLKIEDKTYEYAFAKADSSAVHAGYALSVLLISEKLKEQINNLNDKGVSDFIITGHSQGGALATMTRAYLENLPESEFALKNNYKSYAYAQPMCGNKEFAQEYNQRFSEQGTSYSIINPKDPVPNLPFNYEEDKLITKDKIKGWLFGEANFEPTKFGQDALIRLMEGGLTKHIKNSNRLISKIVSFQVGDVELPEFVSDINYFPTGEVKELPTFKYPKIQVNVTGMTEDELADYEQDEDGSWYKKEKKFFQHKPYNYYVYVLKEWDPEAYNNLEMTYLESDL